MKLSFCFLLMLGALLPSRVNAGPIYELVRKIENPNGPVDGITDDFGYSLDRVGENLLVGAYQEDTGAPGAGAAYLFDPDGNLLTTFRNPTPLENDGFGFAVAGLGDKVIVGAWKEGSVAEKSGAAYLYEADGTLLQTFMNPTPEAGDQFGFSLTAVGDKVLIAAPWDSTMADISGAAYLFDQQGELLETFFMPGAIGREVFGYRVAPLSDSTFFIDSAESIGGYEDAGAVYVYDIDGGKPLRIPNPEPFHLDAFGRSISLVGEDTILIGASQADTASGISAGAAYLYDLDGNLLQRIENPTPATLDWFGRDSLGVSDDTFIVGAAFDDTLAEGLGQNTGAAYLFNTDGELLQTFFPLEPAPSGQFGSDFEVIGDRLFIGAHFDGGRFTGAGAVYEYRRISKLQINGGGETYVEDFDVMGTNTGIAMPRGWSGEDRDGPTGRVESLGLNDGPANYGDEPILGINNVGGSPEHFGSSGDGRVATWKADLNRSKFFDEADVVADGAVDRALGVFREAVRDPGELSFEITIAEAPLRAFTFDWDLELWGGDPDADYRGTDGGGFRVNLIVGETFYYRETELFNPGDLFDTEFDGASVKHDATLIDGNFHSRRDLGSDGIIEVDPVDGAEGNTIKILFDSYAGPETFGWTPSVDNVRLRALAPGDVDGNGTVDPLDIVELLKGGQFDQGVNGVTWQQGDFNGDDKFDPLDLVEVLTFLSGQFPATYASEVGTNSDVIPDGHVIVVPEPSTWILLTVGGLFLVGWRARSEATQRRQTVNCARDEQTVGWSGRNRLRRRSRKMLLG